jgi:hypothetical protein
MLQPLPVDDSQHLDALQGCPGLGALTEARAELNQLSPEAFENPVSLSMHCVLLAKERNWEALDSVARIFAERADRG